MKIQLTSISKGGKPIFVNEEAANKYFLIHDGQRMIHTIQPEVLQPLKQRLYGYLFTSVLDAAVRGYTRQGYSGIDEVSVMYMLKGRFAKSFYYDKDGNAEPYLLDLREMNVTRLHKFTVDSIFHIETDLETEVAAAEEYKNMKIKERNSK